MSKDYKGGNACILSPLRVSHEYYHHLEYYKFTQGHQIDFHSLSGQTTAATAARTAMGSIRPRCQNFQNSAGCALSAVEFRLHSTWMRLRWARRAIFSLGAAYGIDDDYTAALCAIYTAVCALKRYELPCYEQHQRVVLKKFVPCLNPISSVQQQCGSRPRDPSSRVAGGQELQRPHRESCRQGRGTRHRWNHLCRD